MQDVPTIRFATMPTFHQLWDVCMERYLSMPVDVFAHSLKSNGPSESAKTIDACVGSGSFAIELLRDGYNLTTADGNAGMLDLFRKKLQANGIAHEPILAKWTELPYAVGKKRFDAVICCGNSLIYAGEH